MITLEINNIKKLYGKEVALNNFSATFSEGIYGVLGRNGAGKTTLFRVIVGMLKANEGNFEVSIDEKAVPSKEFSKHIGYLPQDFGIYSYYSIQEVMEELCIIRGIPKNIRRKEIDDLLEKVNLKGEKKKKVGALSGGMKRRLGLAQAMIGSPEILIVDEPTAGVDPEERIRIRQLLGDYAVSHIVIISTHIVEDIAHICENVIILESGNVKFNGRIQDLISEAKEHLGETYFDSLSDFQEYAKKENIISFYREGQGVRAVINNSDKKNANVIGLEDAYMWVIKGE